MNYWIPEWHLQEEGNHGDQVSCVAQSNSNAAVILGCEGEQGQSSEPQVTIEAQRHVPNGLPFPL